VSMVVSVLQLRVVVMMLLPVVFALVAREVSRDGSPKTLLCSSFKIVVAVTVLLAIIKSGMNCVLVVWVRMSIVVMVEIMIQLRLRWVVLCVLSVGVMMMIAVVTQIVEL